MNHASHLPAPWQSILWPKNNSLIKQTLLVLAGVLLLAVAAQLSVPMRPVPITFQSTAVILIGMAYGPRYSAYVVGCYLLAGIGGLPVFEGLASGSATFLGPTCGYLIGFLPAAILSGYLAQKGWAKNVFTSFIVACLGVSIIFLCGITVLTLSYGWDRAIMFGLLPFILSEPIKLIAVACVMPKFWKKSS